MKGQEFKIFLEKRYTQKSVKSRMSRARKDEEILGCDLDEAVSSDDKMAESLRKLQEHDNKEENYQNTLRIYYEFVHGKAFPKLNEWD